MSRRFTHTALGVGLIALAACGGSDSSEIVGDPVADSDVAEVPGESETDEQQDTAQDTAEVEGPGSATLTLDDGTIYSFVMSTCETSATSPETFLVDPGFDAFGRTDDGFTLQLIRAAFEESPDLQPTAGFEGEYDENGVNPEVFYIRDGDADLQIDGGRIFGTVTFRDLGSQQPIHGGGFTAAVEVAC